MNKISSMGRTCIATDIATPAPVHKVRYAAMHIGHFGSRISRVPEPTHPGLVLLHGGGDTIETSFGDVLLEFAPDRQVSVF